MYSKTCGPNHEAVSGALSLSGLANVNMRKGMLSRHCYIPSFPAQALQNTVPNNFIQCMKKYLP